MIILAPQAIRPCRGNRPARRYEGGSAILGMAYWNATEKDITTVHAGLVAGLAHGTLRPVIGRELPLKDAPAAHEAVMSPGAYGKIVLIP